ncbi:MAG: SdrD B-like domain-containing protein [Candidatus Krumholzibacteriales bacterium]
MKRAFCIIILLIAIAPARTGAAELVTGGGFEEGAFSAGWVHGAALTQGMGGNPDWADHEVVMDLSYEGGYSALLGFKYTVPKKDRLGYMYQDLFIPADISSATLYFKFRQQGYDGQNQDPFIAEIRDLSGNTLETVVQQSFSERNYQFKDSGWIDDDGAGPAGFDLSGYAGMNVRIYFEQLNSNDGIYQTWTFIDNVSVIFKRFVDLTVDADGEDRFGEPGTGDGGYSLLSGEEGETLTYNLTLENEGLDANSYTITSSPPPGWAVVLNYEGVDRTLPWVTPVLAPGEVISAQVRVSIPAGESLGSYSTILDAVSTSDGNRYDSVEMAANVVPADYLPDMSVDGDGAGAIGPEGSGGYSLREVNPGNTVSYTLDVVNEGIQTDSFRMWFQPDPPLSSVIVDGGVTHSGQFTFGPLASGESGTFQLEVTVPADANGGDYNTLVFCQSLGDTLKKDGITAVSRVLAPAVDAVICGSGDGIIDPAGSGLGGSGSAAGLPGSTVYFPLDIQNESGIADSFAVEWNPPDAGWSAVINDGTADHALPWTTPEFEPLSENRYFLAVTIPAGADYQNETSILNITSAVDPGVSESVTANIVVTSGSETDLLIDSNGDGLYGGLGTGLGGSASQNAYPGDTLSFQVEVQNESGEDLFDLQWSGPAGWEVGIGDSSSTMRGISAGVYTLEVIVPASCSAGSFSIILDGVKTNKRYLVDSVEGTVNVTMPPQVDALVDGNGDGLYADAGTGAGGTSSASSMGGRTEQFALEVQNEGSNPESYRIEWNSFSGWSALLDGSASPSMTGVISGGASQTLIFEVISPINAPEGSYHYIIDIISTADSAITESVTASVDINSPPRIDLAIEGNGDNQYGSAGSGAGGAGVISGNPGETVTASLTVSNRGGYPDSFLVSWQDPAGWPAGSVVISDGTGDYSSPFVTGIIDPGVSVSYTVRVSVPAGAGLRSSLIIDGKPAATDIYDSVLLEVYTGSVVSGIVFEDTDHDGIPDAGESGYSGVTVLLTGPAGDLTAVTDGGGNFSFEVLPGESRQVIEVTPAGMVSITPDTVDTGVLSAGDTVSVSFADVASSIIQPSLSVNATAGGTVDLAHTITAGTGGQASISAAAPADWIEVFYRDQNGDGVLDSDDTILTADDLNLDPEVPGRDIVHIIMRLYLPLSAAVGNTYGVEVVLDQLLSGTSIHSVSSVSSTVTVMANATGMLDLVKSVDLTEARPGDLVTYTISFSNPGTEGVTDIEIIDPVSASVDLVTDAFGPGQDIIWVRGGASVYLTADPADADEAGYSGGTLRVELSRQSPYTLESGMEDQIIYQVRIK